MHICSIHLNTAVAHVHEFHWSCGFVHLLPREVIHDIGSWWWVHHSHHLSLKWNNLHFQGCTEDPSWFDMLTTSIKKKLTIFLQGNWSLVLPSICDLKRIQHIITKITFYRSLLYLQVTTKMVGWHSWEAVQRHRRRTWFREMSEKCCWGEDELHYPEFDFWHSNSTKGWTPKTPMLNSWPIQKLQKMVWTYCI